MKIKRILTNFAFIFAIAFGFFGGLGALLDGASKDETPSQNPQREIANNLSLDDVFQIADI